MEGGSGPGVVPFACNTGSNEEMVFDPAASSICSKSSTATAGKGQTSVDYYPKTCLDVRTTPPNGGGGGGGSYDVQIWAKPQPNGAVAVLVINAAMASTATAGNVTVTFNMSEIKFSGGAAAQVVDIWTGEQHHFAGLEFRTDLIGVHDSRFYLFSPQ
jgi:hypothetical protein